MAVLLGALGPGLVWVPASHASDGSDGVTLNLVVTNDFHGRIDDNLVQWAATVDQLLSDEAADGSLFLAAGDNVGLSVPASAEQDDDPTIDVFNRLGLDATGVGNHEFDQGGDGLGPG